MADLAKPSRRRFLKAAMAVLAAPTVARLAPPVTTMPATMPRALPAAAAAPVYQFADPTFIGKSFVLEDSLMYIKRESFQLEFFAYETQGFAVINKPAPRHLRVLNGCMRALRPLAQRVRQWARSPAAC
jgi:hypothetical protein